MYQLEIYNHFSLQTTRWHSKNLPYVHFEFLGLKKNLLWTTAAGYRLRLTYTQDERGLKMEITVFLLRSQICQSESLCQTDPIFGKINGKIRSDTQKLLCSNISHKQLLSAALSESVPHFEKTKQECTILGRYIHYCLILSVYILVHMRACSSDI